MSKHAQMTTEAASYLRQMKEANKQLKQKEQMQEDKIMQLQSRADMLQDDLEGAQGQTTTLQKDNAKLLVSNNPQAKTHYLDK